MSFKSKDLHYEKQEPSFLRRLKSIHSSADGRNNVQIARPQKARLKTGDGDEDEPLIIDQNGDVVGRKEFEGLVSGNGVGGSVNGNEEQGRGVNGGGEEGGKGMGADGRGNEKVDEGDGERTGLNSTSNSKSKQENVGIGAVRKRKQIKAIGGDSDEEGSLPLFTSTTTTTTKDKQNKNTTNETMKGSKPQVPASDSKNDDKAGVAAKSKKKSKKIKLSFDEPE